MTCHLTHLATYQANCGNIFWVSRVTFGRNVSVERGKQLIAPFKHASAQHEFSLVPSLRNLVENSISETDSFVDVKLS